MISDIPFAVLVTAITGFVWLVTYSIRKYLMRQKSKMRLSKSQEADAVILDMQQTGLYINYCQQIKLQMQVLPDKGRNFVLEAEHMVSRKELEGYKCGNKLRIKFIPGDHYRKPFIAEYRLLQCPKANQFDQ